MQGKMANDKNFFPEFVQLSSVYTAKQLRWIFGKWDVGVWTGLGWLRIATGGGRL
jgi:hypothetical protein